MDPGHPAGRAVQGVYAVLAECTHSAALARCHARTAQPAAVARVAGRCARRCAEPGARAGMGPGFLGTLAAGRSRCARDAGDLCRRRAVGLPRKSRPSRPRWHLAVVAASAFRRDRALAHCQHTGGAAQRTQWRGHRRLYPPVGMARFCVPPAASLPGHHHAKPQPALRRLRLGHGGSCHAGRMAARAHRHPDRRCGAAAAVAHRLDAQPRAHDRGEPVVQASARALAGGRALVLGHLGGCGPGQQHDGLAVGGRHWRRCRAVFPRVQSGDAGREIRPASHLHRALDSRLWQHYR